MFLQKLHGWVSVALFALHVLFDLFVCLPDNHFFVVLCNHIFQFLILFTEFSFVLDNFVIFLIELFFVINS